MMISTSEIKVSCVIEPKFVELAVRELHRAFELDLPPEQRTLDGFRKVDDMGEPLITAGPLPAAFAAKA